MFTLMSNQLGGDHQVEIDNVDEGVIEESYMFYHPREELGIKHVGITF